MKNVLWGLQGLCLFCLLCIFSLFGKQPQKPGTVSSNKFVVIGQKWLSVLHYPSWDFFAIFFPVGRDNLCNVPRSYWIAPKIWYVIEGPGEKSIWWWNYLQFKKKRESWKRCWKENTVRWLLTKQAWLRVNFSTSSFLLNINLLLWWFQFGPSCDKKKIWTHRVEHRRDHSLVAQFDAPNNRPPAQCGRLPVKGLITKAGIGKWENWGSQHERLHHKAEPHSSQPCCEVSSSQYFSPLPLVRRITG